MLDSNKNAHPYVGRWWNGHRMENYATSDEIRPDPWFQRTSEVIPCTISNSG